MKEFEKYPKNYKYLVAVSGGPDSMALLDMLYKDNFTNLNVALVNYKKRKVSDDEQLMVEEFCKKRNIPFYYSVYNDENLKGSFQVKAREYRYNFFVKLYFSLKCQGLFVAHQKDDLIETYLLKKKRNVINESYLILSENIIKKMMVLRPLLNFYKSELEEYCLKNNIPYSIDETNLLPIYTRNKIRISLKKQDKEKIYQEALKAENNLQKTITEVKEFIEKNKLIKICDLKNKNDLFLQFFLYYKIDSKYQKKVNKNLLNQLKNMLNSSKSSIEYLIVDNYYLIKAYDKIILSYIDNVNFSYEVNDFKKFKTPYFEIVDSGKKMQGIYLTKEDFPIIIRNYKKEDKIKLKSGEKKVSRLFIDKKIPLFLRNTIPLIENKNHEIIFVYGLYRKYLLINSQNNYFMLQYTIDVL